MLRARGVQEQPYGLDRGGAENDDFGGDALLLLRQPVDVDGARRLAGPIVDGDLLHDSVGSSREASRLTGGEDPEWHAMRIGRRVPPRHDLPFGPPLFDDVLHVPLDRREKAGADVLPVGKLREAVRVPVEADELLDAVVPRLEIAVRDRPRVARIAADEVVLRHSKEHAAVGMEASAELAAADPEEELSRRRRVRVLAIVHEQRADDVTEECASRLDMLAA